MSLPMHPLFDSEHLFLAYDQLQDWLHATWKSEQDERSIVEGCSHILRFQQQQRCAKLLMDGSGVRRMWEHAAEWGGRVWFPALRQTGLRYVAWVHAPGFYGRMSFDLAIQDVQQPIVCTFDDAAPAAAWLARV
jgi:hypothetical protein